nr:IS630 family transposase [Schleiferilactobacillus shenzhenensis]
MAEINRTSPAVVSTAVRTFAAEGIEAVLSLKRSDASNHSRQKMTGADEARIIQLLCEPVPDGHARWTLVLLEEKVKLMMAQPVKRDAIGRMLKKKQIKPHKSAYWALPARADAAFVANMEDVLDVYQRAYSAKLPVICFDEKPVVLHGDVLKPLPMRPGSIQKIDYVYIRYGYCAIMGFIEPLTGKQYTDVRPTRKAVDFAEVVKHLVDDLYPEAEKVVLVMDNLNTHQIGSLYKRFSPAEANGYGTSWRSTTHRNMAAG